MVQRIDYINGHDEFDGSLWFFDGRYVGHDDQVTIFGSAVAAGGSATVALHHRRIRAGVDPDELLNAAYNAGLDAIEHLLE